MYIKSTASVPVARGIHKLLGFPSWIQLSQTGLLKGVTSEQVRKTKLTVLIGLCAVVLIGALVCIGGMTHTGWKVLGRETGKM